jgi:outer membrane protein OmpA-like peptidoglycan-associated protein
MKKLNCILAVVPVMALGCASAGPSPELLDARRAYDNAREAPQARYTPDRVLEAKQALDRAERAHQDEPGSYEEKSLAYIATRRSELAVIYGSYEADRQDRERAEADYKARQDQLRRDAEGKAAATSQELQGTRAALGSAQSSLAAAMASLEQVAKVKEESRGTVITLDGAVLFASGKTELLPIARQKLDQVAKALNDSAPDQQISVEGHTDAQGDDASNQRLSQGRADSVRAYLVQQGVKSDRITSVGKGETTPIAGNETAEGRANNRRVEIIVQKKSGQ